MPEKGSKRAKQATWSTGRESDVRTVNQGFEEYLNRLTPTQTQRNAGASHRASVKAALEASLPVNRFFESGSFSHGTGVRHHSDIHVFVTSRGVRPESSYATLVQLETVLKSRYPSTYISIDRPAVAVHFGSGYETWEVIPAHVAESRNDHLIYDIPGPQLGAGWIRSAPDAHLKYVNACNSIPQDGRAKALARLVKAWKYLWDVPVSSFYLEMRAAQYVAGQSTYIHIYDFCYLLERLSADGLMPLEDPSGLTGDIRACSSESAYSASRAQLHSAAVRARLALSAYKAGEEGMAFTFLELLFNDQFPSRYD